MAQLYLKIKSDGFQSAKNSLTKINEELVALQRNLDKLGGKEVKELGKDFDETSSKVRRANDNIRDGQRHVKNYTERVKSQSLALKEQGRRLDYLGSKLIPVSIAMLGFTTAVFKAGASFESAFAGVEKTMEAPRFVLQGIREDILRLSQDIPIATNELAKIAELGGQLGVPQSALTNFTDTISKLGVATNLTTDEASTMFAQFLNVMQLDFSNIDNLASVVVQLGNNLPTTERQIMEMSNRLSGYTSILKISGEETMAWAGAMASLGINVEEGGNSLGRSLLKFNEFVANGGDKLKQLANISDMSSSAFKKLWSKDKSQAMLEVVEGLNKIDKAGGDVSIVLKELGVTNTRDKTTLLKLAAGYDTLEQAMKLANDEFKRNQALQIEAKKRFATTESQLQLLKNELFNTGVVIFDKLKPAITDLLDDLVGATKGIRDFVKSLDPSVLSYFAQLSGLLIMTAPVLKLANVGMQLFANALTFYGKNLKSVTAYLAKFSATLSAITFKSTISSLTAFSTQLKTLNTQSMLGGLKQIPSLIKSIGGAVAPVGISLIALYTIFENLPNRARDFKNIINDTFSDFDNYQLGVDETTISSWNTLNDKILGYRNTLALAKLENSTFNIGDITKGGAQQLDIIKESFNDYVNNRILKENELVMKSSVISQKDKDNYLKTVQSKYSDELKQSQTIFDNISKIQRNASKKGRELTKPEIKKIEDYYLQLQQLVQGLDLTPPTEVDKILELAKSGIQLTKDEQDKAVKSIAENARTELGALNRAFQATPQTLDDWKTYQAGVSELLGKIKTDMGLVFGDMTSGSAGALAQNELMFNSMYNNLLNYTDQTGTQYAISERDYLDYVMRVIDANGDISKLQPTLTKVTEKDAKGAKKVVGTIDMAKAWHEQNKKVEGIPNASLNKQGKGTGDTFNKGVTSSNVGGKTQTTLNALEKSTTPDLESIGEDTMLGFKTGSGKVDIGAAFINIVDAGITALKNFLGIKSPSRTMMPVGRDMARGIGVGFIKAGEHIRTAPIGVMKQLLVSINKSTADISGAFSNVITEGIGNSMVYSKYFAYTAGKELVTAFNQGVSEAEMTTAKNINEEFINEQVYNQIMANDKISESDKEMFKKRWEYQQDLLEQQNAQEQAEANVTTVRDTKLQESETQYEADIAASQATYDADVKASTTDINNKIKAEKNKVAKLKAKFMKDGKLSPSEEKALEKARDERDKNIEKLEDKLDKQEEAAAKRQEQRDADALLRQQTRDELIAQNYELDLAAVQAKYGSLDKARQELESMGYTVDFVAGEEILKITGKQETTIDNSTNIDNSTDNSNITINANNVDAQQVVEILYREKRKGGVK